MHLCWRRVKSLLFKISKPACQSSQVDILFDCWSSHNLIRTCSYNKTHSLLKIKGMEWKTLEWKKNNNTGCKLRIFPCKQMKLWDVTYNEVVSPPTTHTHTHHYQPTPLPQSVFFLTMLDDRTSLGNTEPYWLMSMMYVYYTQSIHCNCWMFGM